MAAAWRACYARCMLKWALTLIVLGALAAAGAWYPIRGRTALERWRAASGPLEFVERSASEAKQALGLGAKSPPPSRVARSKGSPRPTQPRHPTESHTDEDRAALDRLLAERADR